MYFIFVLLSLLFGLIFIASALKCALPIPMKVYDGVVCNIEDDPKIVTVEYMKKGEKCQGTFRFGDFSNSMNSFDFHYHVGMKVRITLQENNNIQTLMIPKDNGEKGRISWGLLLIGLLMVGFGVCKSVQIITYFIHNYLQ